MSLYAGPPPLHKPVDGYVVNVLGDSTAFWLVTENDTVWLTPAGLYWEPATTLDSALLDSIHDGLGRFAGGTSDSMQVDTSGVGVYAKIYGTSGYAFTFREGMGIGYTVTSDTLRIYSKLGTGISSDEIYDSAVTVGKIDHSDAETNWLDAIYEANTLSDTGTFNGTEGFGLAGGKTGVALKVKGLIEGSNITIAASGDSGYTITGSAGGFNWTDSTGFLVGWGGVAKSVVNDTNYFRFEGGADFDTTGGNVSIAVTTSATWAGRVGDETGTGVWVFGTSPTFTTDLTSPLIIGGTETTSDLILKTTSGVGASGSDMHFRVGNNGATEAMTILKSGNVGVGTIYPNSVLHIRANTPGTIGSHPAGQLIIQDPDDDVNGVAVITGYESDGPGNPDQQLWYLGSSSSGNEHVTFLNRRNSNLTLGTNGTSHMTIDGGGDVGIGDATPAEKLSVAGNISVTGTVDDVDVLALNTGVAGDSVAWREKDSAIVDFGGGSYKSSSVKAWSMKLGANLSATTPTDSAGIDTFTISAAGGAGGGWTDDGNYVRLTTIGDSVGIGTTTPDERLHVTGNNASLKLEDDSGNDAKINIGNSQLCIAVDPDNLIASSDICFDIDGNEVARFHASTNFGIGTLSPPERLSVVGNIATGDTTTGDVDVIHYFSTDGSYTTEWFRWNDGLSLFELSDDFDVTGNITVSGTVDTVDVAALAAKVHKEDLKYYMFNLADPDALYAVDAEWSIDPRTAQAITIDSFTVTLNADPTTELTFSLKFADAFIGLATATVIDDTATVAGVTTVTGGFGDATVPAGKCIYWLFDADPDDAITQASVKIYYSID